MKIKGETILIIGALIAGAYFLYKMFGGTVQAVSDVVGGVGQTIDTGKQILQQPVVPDTPEIGIKAPTVIDYIFPPAGIPKFIDNFVTDNTGKANVMTAPIKAALTVGLVTGALEPSTKTVTAIGTTNTTGLSKAEVQQAVTQMDTSYKKFYPAPPINKAVPGKKAALITNFNKLQTPAVQIQAYNVAQKVVKVDGAFKKVM